MAITYEVPEIGDQKSVSIRFINDEGKILDRAVNVPRNADGTLNEQEWNVRLEQQLNSVYTKVERGVGDFITYVEPVGPLNAMDLLDDNNELPITEIK
jgi:hypothetical protein